MPGTWPIRSARAGVDVVETDTFWANWLTLMEYGLESKAREMNRTAAALARRVADEYAAPERPRFVAGSIGPSGERPSTSRKIFSVSVGGAEQPTATTTRSMQKIRDSMIYHPKT